MPPSAPKTPAARPRGRSKADNTGTSNGGTKKMPKATAASSSPASSSSELTSESPPTKTKKTTRTSTPRKSTNSAANKKSATTATPAVELAKKRLEAFNLASAQNSSPPQNANENPSAKKKDNASSSAGRASKNSKSDSLPASPSNLAPADKLLWEGRNNGRRFENLVTEYTRLSKQKTTAAALSSRFWQMKRKYVYWTKSDTDDMLDVLGSMHRIFESEKWSMVSEELRRTNKICFAPEQIRDRFESLEKSGELPIEFLPNNKNKEKQDNIGDGSENDTQDENVESFMLGETPAHATKRKREELTLDMPLGYECVSDDDEMSEGGDGSEGGKGLGDEARRNRGGAGESGSAREQFMVQRADGSREVLLVDEDGDFEI